MFRKHFLASINQLLFSDDFQVGRLVASEAELLLCFELHRQTLAVPSASEIYEISAHRGEAIPKILDEPPSHMPDVGFAVETTTSTNPACIRSEITFRSPPAIKAPESPKKIVGRSLSRIMFSYTFAHAAKDRLWMLVSDQAATSSLTDFILDKSSCLTGLARN